MNIHDTIRAAYAHWELIDQTPKSIDSHIRTKEKAYKTVCQDHSLEDTHGVDCFFCDYAVKLTTDDETNECHNCPAAGMWSNEHRTAECLSPGAPYHTWMKTGDAKPMLDLIKRVAEKHNTELPK